MMVFKAFREYLEGLHPERFVMYMGQELHLLPLALDVRRMWQTSKGKALFLGVLQMEIAFFPHHLPCQDKHLHRDTVPPRWQQGKRGCGFVGPSLTLLTSFIIISVPLLLSHLLLTQRLGE